MNNNINDISEIKCTSCQVCKALCPVDAISISNVDGFYRPVVDESKCVHCGICKNNCVKYSDQYRGGAFQPSCFSAKILDASKLRSSSSGGVALGISEYMFNKGASVYGAAFDIDHNLTYHKKAETLQDILDFCGSKYMQSKVDVYRDVVEEIKNKKKNVVFIGCPCQTAALDIYLKKNGVRKEALLIDFYCHGTPSKELWDKYLEKVKQKIGEIKHIEFRTKKYGWHRFGNYMVGSNGEYKKKNDIFYKLFFSDCLLNDSCYDCPIAYNYGFSDIRIGDFWGYKYDRDKTGVSVVCVNSQRGENVLHEVTDLFTLQRESIDEVEKYQTMHKRGFNPELNKAIMNLVKSGELNKADKLYIKSLGLLGGTKKRIKRVISNFAFPISSFLRKLYHRKKD